MKRDIDSLYGIFKRQDPNSEWALYQTWNHGLAIYTSLGAARGVVTSERNSHWYGTSSNPKPEYKIMQTSLAFEDFEGGVKWKTASSR